MKMQEFKQLCQRLEVNFERELPDDKVGLWFEKLRFWPAEKFERVVEILLEESERFPALSQVLKAGYAIPEEQKAAVFQDCRVCDGVGCVTAIYLHGAERYKTCFRCYNCFNWQGKFSEVLPIWSDEFLSKNYILELDDTEFLSTEETEGLIKRAFPKIEFGKRPERKIMTLDEWEQN